MTIWQRLRTAAVRRAQGPYLALGRLDARMHDAQRRLAALEETVEISRETRGLVGETRHMVGETRELASATHQLLSGEMRAILRALAAEESANRRRLYDLRTDPAYRSAWTDPRPLVTVTVATRDRAQLLASRSLPSILGQSHSELEVIVVGDDADAATEAVVRGCGDPRVSFYNLPQRLTISDDPRRRWLVAATMARNEAVRRAGGRWIVQFDDDDAMHPDCIERLLVRSRENEAEAVYARVLARRENEQPFEIGSFPPQEGRFTWAAGMYHAGLRFFHRELFAADMGLPGDWFLAERMLRAGVRFGMVDAVLCDIYPSAMNTVQPTGA
jgi:glycosyl transferase family 2